MRVYHFVNCEYGLQDIARRRLKVATLADVNDPFEMLSLNLKDSGLRATLGKARKEFGERRGMLCFSRGWRNPVQWSHYADHHRGLCLGFDVPDRLLRDVQYRKSRAAVDATVIDAPGFDMGSFVLKALDVKFVHWTYEDEVRMIVDLETYDDVCRIWYRGFDGDLVLREVIVGADCPATRAQVAEALGDGARGVVAHKARLAFGTYRVVTQRREDLWQ